MPTELNDPVPQTPVSGTVARAVRSVPKPPEIRSASEQDFGTPSNGEAPMVGHPTPDGSPNREARYASEIVVADSVRSASEPLPLRSCPRETCAYPFCDSFSFELSYGPEDGHLETPSSGGGASVRTSGI